MFKTISALLCTAAAGLTIALVLSSENQLSAFAESPLLTTNSTVPQDDGYRYNQPNDGGFQVEVLVNGYPIETYFARGRRYVEARETSEYQLRVRNPLGVRVAVALSVDGLNSIDAKHTSAESAAKWIIEPYGTITVSGWQVSQSRARRFYFTTESQSYGAKMGRTSDLGVISAAFFRERSPVVVQPRDYPITREEESRNKSGEPDSPSLTGSAPSDGAGVRSDAAKRPSAQPMPDNKSAATGIGRSSHNDVSWVHLDLESSPSAQVSIRYEYRAQLVRLGILPRPYPNDADSLRRRERAQGFEDRRYSPEP